MRYSLSLLALSTGFVLASQSTFDPYDDLAAFPQYEVVWSKQPVSELDAQSLLNLDASTLKPSDSKDVDSHSSNAQSPSSPPAMRYDYERMMLSEHPYLCSIPRPSIPEHNETSAADARVQEAKELSRATARGWELINEMNGKCLYFLGGWWSYSFCYNKDVTQFHALPVPPGGNTLERDPNTAVYILGRAPSTNYEAQQDEYGNQVAVRSSKHQTIQTEMQVKGDTRYLVQHLEHGTICDLTGKPRRTEVQYHCSTHGNDRDRIGWIKEVTTCSYIMVVYTQRLCDDVAFHPPKPLKPYAIECKSIIPEDEFRHWKDNQNADANADADGRQGPIEEARPTVGGVVVGGRKFVPKDGWPETQKATSPEAERATKGNPQDTEIVAKRRPTSDGGLVEVLDDEALINLDLDPEKIRKMMEKLAADGGDDGWEIQVVEGEGQLQGIFVGADGTINKLTFATDSEGERKKKEKEKEREQPNKGEDDEQGSQETFHEEL